eukprot:TRINITY_DN2038_c0_g1_i1.p1 TRINITY_DN2038_c0_g1~~TRINITY_DN2038_c0_g1_i1.p1  ORF type:complete len:363 (-),score=197.20 TRINITY_DN2038_c0_g1_i1:113-1201(-)
MTTISSETTHESVQEYYGQVLKTNQDLKTSACCAASAPPKPIKQALSKVPSEIIERFYGCGNPIPLEDLKGLSVLDLGCGTGRDCYVAASLVGENGKVIGIDMTNEQLQVAIKYAEQYCLNTLKFSKNNLNFIHGYIEKLTDQIQSNSIDLVISNCVINLSPDKKSVLQQVYEVLREGGEFYFSDVYSDRRLPKEATTHSIAVGECLGGALYKGDFIRLCSQVGFIDPRIVSQKEIQVNDPQLRQVLGAAKFYSITFRLFKLKNLETECEDYAQIAIYLGTLDNYPINYQLDDHHNFEKGRPVLVCGNTASMLQETRLAKHFNIIGSREVHYGLFDCSSSTTVCSPNSNSNSNSNSSSSSCC